MPEIASIAWLLQNLEPEFDAFVAQITQSLRVDPKAYNWESLTANLLDEAKRLQVSSFQKVQHLKKAWKNKNKSTILYCKYCKLAGHEDKDCNFLHPEKAPKGWKHSLKPKDEYRVQKKKEKEPREKREEKILALIASESQSSKSSSEKASEEEDSEESDIELEDVPLGESLDEMLEVNNPHPINTITNNSTVLNLGFQLQETIDRVLELSNSGDTKNVYKYNFIFDTGASVHVIINKD